MPSLLTPSITGSTGARSGTFRDSESRLDPVAPPPSPRVMLRSGGTSAQLRPTEQAPRGAGTGNG